MLSLLNWLTVFVHLWRFVRVLRSVCLTYFDTLAWGIASDTLKYLKLTPAYFANIVYEG